MTIDVTFGDFLALPKDDAYSRVMSFARRFGEAHVTLAMHAAFPLGLSPELVHLLRINMVPRAPFIAEADLLLSSLCRETGGGLYEMDPAARELLLDELVSDTELGLPQLFRIANFVMAYAERAFERTNDPDLRGFLRVQQWAALARLEPEQAARELTEALRTAEKQGDSSRAMRLVRITDALSAPLAGQRILTRYAAQLKRRLEEDQSPGVRDVLTAAADTVPGTESVDFQQSGAAARQPRRRTANPTQTLIIRIEDPPTPNAAFPIRGLSVGPEEQSEAEHVVGTIPWPLPELDPGQPGRDALADLRRVMLAPGDPDFAPDQVGRYLWRLLAETEVGAWWQEAEHAAADGQVRTVLDVQATQLRTLPWELLTRDLDGWRPFQSREKPWTRGEGAGEPADDLLVAVRMLVVVGDPDDPSLQVDDELDAIFGATREFPGRWHVDVRVNPAPAVMRSVLEDLRPHILHIIAHGSVARSSAILVIGNKQNSWEMTTIDVADLPSPAPRLVVLNACRSGAAADNGLAASWTFTDAFLGRGCGAVVTMQGNIPSAAAVPFSAAFYREIASGQPVDVAAARGREAASDARGLAQDSRSWAMPSLYTRVQPDRVLPVQLAVNPDVVHQPPYRAAYEPVSGYVDRTKERWELVRRLAPEAGRPRQPLFLVAGPRKVGKSAVVKWALLTCHLHGRRVAYVDLLDCGQRLPGWLTVLRYIRDEVRRWLPQAATPAQRFDHELAFLKERQIPDEYTPESARSDDGQAFDQASEDFQEWIRRIFASFRTLLATTAGDEPLVLVLDHLYTIYDPDLRNYLVPELLAPIAREEIKNVHAVLAGEASWFEGLHEADPSLYMPEPITVPMFRLGEIHRLGREYCARINKLPVTEPIVHLLNALLDESKECTGDELRAAFRILELKAG